MHFTAPGIGANEPLTRVLREVCAGTDTDTSCWCVTQSDDELWFRFQQRAVSLPEQGWKLHISADHASAEAILLRTLPILLAEATSFKVAASLDQLNLLNQGDRGSSQAGKFITVFPKDNREAVHLAVRLDEATRGLSGPKVPSDRPLKPGSLVHYRYGAFRQGLYIQSLSGAILPAIKTPDNDLVPDLRLPKYQVPSWAEDPFIAAGTAEDPPASPHLLGERYLLITTIAASVHHILYLAADLEVARSCVIKGPGYAWQHNRKGQASLRHEAEMLARLGPDPRIPAFYDLIEQDGDLFLVTQDIEGETLDAWMGKRRKLGHCPLPQAINWTLALVEILEDIHAKGIVYGDVKSSNVIVDPQGRLYLIDFEHAHEQRDAGTRGGGTPGYMAPQQQDGQAGATIQSDIYGCGALLYFLVTAAEPSMAPNPRALLERPIELLRPGIGTPIKELITRALHEDPAARYPSMREFKNALLAIAQDPGIYQSQSAYKDAPICANEREGRAHYRELAQKLLHTLCAVAKQPDQSDGLAWESHSPTGMLIRPDLYNGSGGIVLALADLVSELADTDARSVLARGAEWLRWAPAMNNQPLPGFYIGEAGVGAALLRAGQTLHDETLIRAAVERGRLVASLPYASPDIMTGTAGRLRFHLLLWDETGEQEHLQAAITCGESLLQAAKTSDQRGMHYWEIPAGYGTLSGERLLGYAHGAAGIADALLDLFIVTSNERLLPVIQGVSDLLRQWAIPALADESGLNWPIAIGGAEGANPFWCHGATGIGRFFLNAASCDIIPGAREIAARAARTIAYSARWLGPTQCHGLAGNIELLLDMYQATGDHSYYEEALAHARLLEAFATERKGFYIFPTAMRNHFTPDYMLGYAGIAICLLRLSAPERIPHQLSRAGFRSHMQPASPSGSR